MSRLHFFDDAISKLKAERRYMARSQAEARFLALTAVHRPTLKVAFGSEAEIQTDHYRTPTFAERRAFAGRVWGGIRPPPSATGSRSANASGSADG